MASARPFEAGSRILHIGPPKTATSSLQGAMHISREALAEHGVRYAGPTRHARSAATFAALGRVPAENSPRSGKVWRKLAEEIRTADERLVFASSEAFSMARAPEVDTIVRDVGGAPQIVITIRPLAVMLASSWQQRVRNEGVKGFEAWLRSLFAKDGSGVMRAWFWERYGLSQLIDRWGAAVGPENITVVVLDPSDRSMLLRSFDELLGLPADTLQPDTQNKNESLPYPEIEVLRHFNKLYTASGGDRVEWVDTVRRHALLRVRTAEEQVFQASRIDTPRWAARAANEVVEGWITVLETSGVRVLGDPTHMLVSPDSFPESVAVPRTVSTESAARLALLMYEAARDHFGGTEEVEDDNTAVDSGDDEPAPAASAQRRPKPVAARMRAALRVLRG